MLNIKNRRECFFDDFLIDTEKTTAKRILHHPVKRERVLLHDAPWEGDGCTYHHIFFDPRWHGVKGDYPNGTYRMYYLGYHGGEFCEFWNKDQLEGGFRICYAESGDGIHFEKPDLGICTYGGSTHNNLILDKTIHPESCQLYVFYDENPDCPESERYKGITETSFNLGTVEFAAGMESSTVMAAMRCSSRWPVMLANMQMVAIGNAFGIPATTWGTFDPDAISVGWEEKETDVIAKMYKTAFDAYTGDDCVITAVHGGLECADFASWSDTLEVISVGPTVENPHSVSEFVEIDTATKTCGAIVTLLDNIANNVNLLAN